MRKLSGITLRIALIGAATSGVVAACYDQVPGPSTPVPPTKEAKPLGTKPKPYKPVELNPKFGGTEETPPVPAPTHEAQDAGVDDVLDLPPVPDADVLLDAPGIAK